MNILIAAVLSLALAFLYGKPIPFLKDVGDIFIDLLKMVVVPIAFVSIAGAVMKLERKATIGKAFLLMVFMSAEGIGLGFVLMSLWDIPAMELGTSMEANAPTLMGFLRSCIPVNPVNSLASGNMLQVITLAILVGCAVRMMDEKESIEKVFDAAKGICMKITGFVFYIAPAGVFALLYNAASMDFSGLATGYLQMLATLAGGSILYIFLVCMPVLKLTGINPVEFLKVVIPGDLVGAISGGATNYLAPRIYTLKAKTDIPHESIDLLLPMMSVLMRAGSCICVGIYTVFAASISGVPLTPWMVMAVIALGIIALTAAPGIIGGTLMDCAIIFSAIGIPLEVIGVLAGIDYIMDVTRTVLNIQGGEVVTASGGKDAGLLSA